MGRPEPCILFAQSFVHAELEEYADEVIFSEPVVVTACEFLEQNASPSSTNISLIGATSPPSFAMEVFIHCEGESRFRRLCQPFLYSHSSSNVLEVEAVVTNHLVLRGTYRSLTLVVYGNTAQDLGQFNVEFDTDSSLANVVYSSSEGKLEDLPPALRSTKLTFEEYISSLRYLGFPFPELDISPEVKLFLELALKIYEVSNEESTVSKVVTTVVSAVSSFVKNENCRVPVYWDHHMLNRSIDSKRDPQQVTRVISEAKNGLFEIYQSLVEESNIGSEANLPSSKMLADMFNLSFPILSKASDVENKDMFVVLGMALLLCSSRESCYWIVNGGAMEKIINLLSLEIRKSTATTLLLLGTIEFATQHGIGCEGFLGWWPREDENVPTGPSVGYCYLLELLLKKQRHDVASLASYILHRLRLYEIASRYESSILSIFTKLATDPQSMTDGIKFLPPVNTLLKKILRLLTSSGPVEDPSPMAAARKLLIPGQSEDLLSYRTTIDIIATSKCNFVEWDIDPYLLSLLKETGFFPLSTMLLSSPELRSAIASSMDNFVDIFLSIESILLILLFCRSGLSFLLAQPEATTLMILSLQDVEDMNKAECMTLRQATIFLAKGFFCRPQDVGVITELHLRVGTAIGRLLMTPTNSDELLWVLWELCAISRSNCGREAVLALGHFPEATSVLLDALCSFKDEESVALNSGSPPLSLAIFHSAAEIFEIMVADFTASSLRSWIGHAVELHKALHSSSPGSNRKDAPTRLLELIDPGVIYHRNGATGLLKYAAVLASGGDAHLSSTNVLVSDSIDAENVVGDSTNGSDTQVVDSLLGKLVSDKSFEGTSLRNTSIVQLTTSFRILALLSENSAVAASLFEEGAMTVIYVVLVNCKFMLERLSNTYDYLVDEGAECNSTSDLLLERSHEHSLLDLMIPSLVLLINLLRRLHKAKEVYRNKKLLNALLKLHREVSPKLAASAANLSFPYPSSALGFGAICHLLASALACWTVFGWTPSLFHCVLESVQANTLLALGPKDACSMLCLLGDLFPEEGIWLWKNAMPPLSALRSLSIGTLLGTQMESDINWYVQSEHLSVLLVRLTPQLDRIAQIVLHFAFTSLVVIQDMLRIFIIRIACQKIECAIVLLRPIISWMDSHVAESSPSDSFIIKMHRLLHFIACLLEHPRAKTLLLKVGALKVLQNVLQRCSYVSNADEKLISESGLPSKNAALLSWSYPVFKCLAIIFDSETLAIDKCLDENMGTKEYSSFGCHLLKLCQVLPVGRELVACIITFKELISSHNARSAILSFFSMIQSSAFEEQEPYERDTDCNNVNGGDWKQSPPFLSCWKKLLRALDLKDTASIFVFETIYALSLSAIRLCMEGKDLEGVPVLKFLFGLQYDPDNEKLQGVHDLIGKLEDKIAEAENLASLNRKSFLIQVKESVKSMLYLLQSHAGSPDKLEVISLSDGCHSLSRTMHSVIVTSQLMSPRTLLSMDEDEVMPTFAHIWNSARDAEETSNDYTFGPLAEKFVWECPDSSLERTLVSALPGKRKLASVEGTGRRMRDNSGSEAIGANTFYRALSMPSVSSGPSRRDTFRQRKPNTSRPPSMHVDDYIARERNTDGISSGSNIITSSHHRGASSGRPPSIHVDEFMARQRERQNPVSVTGGDVSQLRNLVRENVSDSAKLDGSQQLKADLDDDLQGINIVFDEESESDDRMPFPQPDDNLLPASVIGEISPGSVVEETEGNANGSTRYSQLEDEASRSDLPLTRPMSQELNPSSRSSGSNDKALFREQSDESKYSSSVVGPKGFDAAPQTNPRSIPPSHSFNVGSASPSVEPLPPPRFYHRNSPQKLPNNQPPLPPMPPPALSALQGQSAEPMQSQSAAFAHNTRDMQPPLPSGFPLQAFDVSGMNTMAGVHIQPTDNLSSTNNNPIVSMATAQTGLDLRYSWNTISSSPRPMPPLPPHPPPFSTQIMQSSASNSSPHSSFYNQTTNVGFHPPPPSTPMSEGSLGNFLTSGNSMSSFALPPFAPSSLINRPASVPGSFRPSIQSMQPRPPPPPPPQLPPPHLPPPVQVSQSEQGMPLQQSTIQFQVQPLQMPQLHIPQLQFYYQPQQQQEPLLQPMQPLAEQGQPQNPHQLQDPGMTLLHQYFSSPEAIQSLLGDRDKLCQLLEQHPKLMQMLQERLGQQ